MDYKEKLRLAKEALESGSYDKDTIEYIFPELAESEDEKIRKEIINHLKYLGKYCQESMPNVNEWIAWLEKQGKQRANLIDIDAMVLKYSNTREKETNGLPVNCQIRSYRQGINDTLNLSLNIEKQGEHKPAYKVEPKFKVKYAGCEYNVLEVKDIVGVTYYGIEDEPNHIDYVKADNCKIISGGYGIKENGSPYPTKPAVFSEQKPQRMVSAEAKEALYDKPTDEEMKELLRTEYEKGRADAIAEMKSSWSEKDEKVIAIINNALTESNTPPDDYDKVYDWLESLRKRIGE